MVLALAHAIEKTKKKTLLIIKTPLPPQTSDKLYQFLQQNNEHATHFFIGTNILANPKEFTTAFDTLNGESKKKILVPTCLS